MAEEPPELVEGAKPRSGCRWGLDAWRSARIRAHPVVRPRESVTVEPHGGKGRSDAIRLLTRIFEGCEKRREERADSARRYASNGAPHEASTRETRRIPESAAGCNKPASRMRSKPSRWCETTGRRRPSRRVARWAEGRETGRERDACGHVDRGPSIANPTRGRSVCGLPQQPTRVNRGSEGEPRPHRRGRSGNRPPGDSTARFEGQPGDGPTATEARAEQPCSTRRRTPRVSGHRLSSKETESVLAEVLAPPRTAPRTSAEVNPTRADRRCGVDLTCPTAQTSEGTHHRH